MAKIDVKGTSDTLIYPDFKPIEFDGIRISPKKTPHSLAAVGRRSEDAISGGLPVPIITITVINASLYFGMSEKH